MMPVFKF